VSWPASANTIKRQQQQQQQQQQQHRSKFTVWWAHELAGKCWKCRITNKADVILICLEHCEQS
jgi:hypothetical protein